MGRLFFGESMFSKQSNASKFAFIKYVRQLEDENVFLVDCQVHTAHLESLGAEMMERVSFIRAIKTYG
jgi:leucyl/phenylalanyl-tRNA--protein transferase